MQVLMLVQCALMEHSWADTAECHRSTSCPSRRASSCCPCVPKTNRDPIHVLQVDALIGERLQRNDPLRPGGRSVPHSDQAWTTTAGWPALLETATYSGSAALLAIPISWCAHCGLTVPVVVTFVNTA